GIDRAHSADGLELQVDADALHAGRVRRMLEAVAALAALQLQRAAPCRLPERPCPLVGDRHGSRHLAPIAHRFVPRRRLGRHHPPRPQTPPSSPNSFISALVMPGGSAFTYWLSSA